MPPIAHLENTGPLKVTKSCSNNVRESGPQSSKKDTSDSSNGAIYRSSISFGQLSRLQIRRQDPTVYFSWTPGSELFYILHPGVSATPIVSGDKKCDPDKDTHGPRIIEWHHDLGVLLHASVISNGRSNAFIVTHEIPMPNTYKKGANGRRPYRRCVGLIQAFSIASLVRTLAFSSGKPQDILACIVHNRITTHDTIKFAITVARSLISPISQKDCFIADKQTNGMAEKHDVKEDEMAKSMAAEQGSTIAWSSLHDIYILRAFVDWCHTIGQQLPEELKCVIAIQQPHKPNNNEASVGLQDPFLQPNTVVKGEEKVSDIC